MCHISGASLSENNGDMFQLFTCWYHADFIETFHVTQADGFK